MAEPVRDPAAAVTSRAVVLGPQPGRVRFAGALDGLARPAGPVAAITVGWRETEPVEREVDREIERAGRRPAALLIGERVGRIFAADLELAAAHRTFQEALFAEERLYRARLRQASAAAREVAGLSAPERWRRRYLREARRAVLAADRFHLANQRTIVREFRERHRPGERPAVRRETKELEAILEGAAAVVLTGGHVAVIRNRLLLLDLGRALAGVPVLAWSAGAMVLSRRIAFYHDHLPSGPASPEVFGEGLAVLPGLAFFPDAGKRLNLEDRESLRELALRMSPYRGVLLDPGDRLDWDGRRWTAAAGMRLLTADGEVERVDSFPVPDPPERNPRPTPGGAGSLHPPPDSDGRGAGHRS